MLAGDKPLKLCAVLAAQGAEIFPRLLCRVKQPADENCTGLCAENVVTTVNTFQANAAVYPDNQFVDLLPALAAQHTSFFILSLEHDIPHSSIRLPSVISAGKSPFSCRMPFHTHHYAKR